MEQNYIRQVRLEKWQSGALVASEEYTLRGDMYLMNEMLLMLKVAGFHKITVRGDYTDEPAAAWPDDQGRALILDMSRATLEVFDEG
jgi:hypothetical protein